MFHSIVLVYRLSSAQYVLSIRTPLLAQLVLCVMDSDFLYMSTYHLVCGFLSSLIPGTSLRL